MAAFGAQAQSSVSIDGNFNAGYQANSYKGVKLKGFDQNGAGTSQINIRGTEDMGGGNAAYFRVETDLSIMRNDANQGVPTAVATGQAQPSTAANFTTMQSNKGLASSWGNGELAVGARSAAYGDIAFGALNNAGLTTTVLTASPVQGTSFGGGYGSIIGADPTLSVVRWGNSIRYITPSFNGLTGQIVNARKQTNQTNTFSASGVASTTPNMGVGQNDQIGATELSAKYVNGPLTLGYVNTKTSTVDASFCASLTNTASPFQVSGQNQPCYNSSAGSQGTRSATIGNGYEAKQNSFAAKYELNSAWTLSGAYQATTLGGIGTSTDQSDRKATMVTATYVTGPHTLFVSHGSAKEAAAANTFNGKKSTMNGIGYNYALSKRTNLVARYETLDDQAGIIAPSYVSSTVNLLNTDANSQKRVRSMFGISHNF